jgi:flavin-dependent dehydrogenase
LKRVIIVGGGLAGLVTSIQLARRGIPCTVIEKRAYPFHRVCGEYISNEVVPFLEANSLFPHDFNPPGIRRFLLSSITGKNEIMPLDLGGFGISRYSFDHFLYQQAISSGVEFHLQQEVTEVHFVNDRFEVKTRSHEMLADVVIGTFGKRSKLDTVLKRPFIAQRSPYVAVKYHIRTDHPSDLIALHNFSGGYCGMSNIEDGKTTLCYLSHRKNLRRFGDVRRMEEEILFKNPFLSRVFNHSEFLFDRPEVINEVSFATKTPLDNHILMAGDAAGMIAPLCGNGMAIAIRSARDISEVVARFLTEPSFTRQMLEKTYVSSWNSSFRAHLRTGRLIQGLFGNAVASSIAVNMAIYFRPLANAIMRSTHGTPFQ